MDALEIRLSDFLRERLRLTAAREASVLETATLLERARRGSSATFLGVLTRVPSAPPLRGYQLPRLVRGIAIAF